MRERLSRDKRATYTYSADYVSQTVSMVDAFRGKEDQEVYLYSQMVSVHLLGQKTWHEPHDALSPTDRRFVIPAYTAAARSSTAHVFHLVAFDDFARVRPVTLHRLLTADCVSRVKASRPEFFTTAKISGMCDQVSPHNFHGHRLHVLACAKAAKTGSRHRRRRLLGPKKTELL